MIFIIRNIDNKKNQISKFKENINILKDKNDKGKKMIRNIKNRKYDKNN